MRRILGIAGLMAGLIGATTVPAAAQGWGYTAYNEPWGPGVGVSVGGLGVGIGAPAYGAYAVDDGYVAGPSYAYSAVPCSCGTAASYGSSRYNVRGYRPNSYAAYSIDDYEPGYSYAYHSSRPVYGYGSTSAYGNQTGYGSRGARIVARGEIQEGVRTRSAVRSSSLIRERSAVRGTSRDQTMGAHERSGSMRAATFRDSNAMMNGPSTDARGSIRPAPQGELRTSTTGRGGAPSR